MPYLCMCGAKMRCVNNYDYPHIYSCPKCGGTLMIDNRGIQRWSNADGKPGTYQPPVKPKKEEKQ